MSLRAGRVGVSPSEVDELGHIKNGGAGGDSYTKEEADNKFAKKTNLTANNKEFQFAYDSETGSYGYKAGGADTFHPFNFKAGGVDEAGLYVTDSASTANITLYKDIIVEGGVEDVNSEFMYGVDYRPVRFVSLKIKFNEAVSGTGTTFAKLNVDKSIQAWWSDGFIQINSKDLRPLKNIPAGSTHTFYAVLSD